MNGEPAFGSFRALGTTVVCGAGDPGLLATVVEVVRDEVDQCDRACSRFREDSELSRLNSGEQLGGASEWLVSALAAALDAARTTAGLVDPTIGQCLVDLGYDRSFERMDLSSPLVVTASHVPAWHKVRVDPTARRIDVPAGVRLDLGATAKALCADRASTRAAEATGAGVLVSLGGDIAMAGPAPVEGWLVKVTDRSDADPAGDGPGQTIAVRSGGLATSGTASRRWARAGVGVHHLVDPRTGAPATKTWRTASVVAPSCVAANAASTAAIILGAEAPGWLRQRGLDARLVAEDGDIVRCGAWPLELAEALA